MQSSERIFLTVCFFLTITVFAYVFSGIAGVNLPRYYPVQNAWSTEKLEGPSMGFYGKLALALVIGVTIAAAFYWVLPRAEHLLELRERGFKGLATTSLLIGILFFIVEEWRHWAIDKTGIEVTGFFNATLDLYLFGIGVFIALELLILSVEKKIND